MNRRKFLGFSAAGLYAASSPVDVQRVYRSAFLTDTHNDIPGKTLLGFDIGSRNGNTHTDVSRLRASGVGAAFFIASGSRSANYALQMIDSIHNDIVRRYPGEFALARSVAEVRAARDRGKIAVLIGLEGGHAIEDSLRLLRIYHSLGVRYMTLTHDLHTNWADSGGFIGHPATPRHNGLTDFGRDVIREMNRLGMVVDVSHVSDKTFWDVLETSRAPVFASHSSCRAICNISRNLSDEMIRALAKNGGTIQINIGPEFISQEHASAIEKFDLYGEVYRIMERRKSDPAARKREVTKFMAEQKAKLPAATLGDAMTHIDHAVKVGGIDAVGLGTDFDGIDYVPVGLEDVAAFPNITRALLEKGYSADDIRKIYGANTLRVMRAVESAVRS